MRKKYNQAVHKKLEDPWGERSSLKIVTWRRLPQAEPSLGPQEPARAALSTCRALPGCLQRLLPKGLSRGKQAYKAKSCVVTKVKVG